MALLVLGISAMPRSRDVVRIVAVGCAVIAGFVVVATTAQMLLLLFAGLLFALVLHSAAQLLSRVSKLPHVVSVIALSVVGFGATAAVVVGFGPRLAAATRGLAAQLPQAIQMARDELHRRGLLPGGNLEPHAFIEATKQLAHMGIEILSAMVVIVCIGVFGALQPEVYKRAVQVIVPRDRERAAGKVLDAVAHDLKRWLFGRLLAMIFMGVAAWIAFTLLKLPSAAALAFLAGALAFIEYLGAWISAVPAGLVALSSHGPGHALAVLVVFTVLHLIEGYLLTPMLARATVHVPPAAVLIGQVIFAALLGPIGLTFSTPLIVVAMSTVMALRTIRDEETLVARTTRREKPVRASLA